MSRNHIIIAVARSVPTGSWTTYGAIGEIVYGHRHGAQTVGNVMRDHALADSAHRVLKSGGVVSPSLIGSGGGPEYCISRLREEGTWDATRGCAPSDRFLSAASLRQLGS